MPAEFDITRPPRMRARNFPKAPQMTIAPARLRLFQKYTPAPSGTECRNLTARSRAKQWPPCAGHSGREKRIAEQARTVRRSLETSDFRHPSVSAGLSPFPSPARVSYKRTSTSTADAPCRRLATFNAPRLKTPSFDYSTGTPRRPTTKCPCGPCECVPHNALRSDQTRRDCLAKTNDRD